MVYRDGDRLLLALPTCLSFDAESICQSRGGRLGRGGVEEAQRLHGTQFGTPTLVTDNGSCFMAHRFHDALGDRFEHVRIKYRTPQQLGLLERFHATLKYEEIYWRAFENPTDARCSLREIQKRYNYVRQHWVLRPSTHADPLTPAEVYVNGLAKTIPRWQGWARAACDKLKKAMVESPFHHEEN